MSLQGYSPLQIFLLCTFLSALIPTVVGIIYFGKLAARYKVLLGLTVTTFLLNGLSNVFWLQKMNNLFLSNFHTLLEFILVYMIYHMSFTRKNVRKWMRWILVGFTLLFSLNMIFLQGFWLLNTYTKALESIILIVFALMNFSQIMNELKVERITGYPMFWLSSGILIYFSSNIFIFILSNYFLNYSTEFYVRIWAIHAVFYIVFEIICALVLWLSLKK